MAQKLNATCKVCGKQYHYCKDCEKLGSWRAVACSPECWIKWVEMIDARDKKAETPVEPIAHENAEELESVEEQKVEPQPQPRGRIKRKDARG